MKRNLVFIIVILLIILTGCENSEVATQSISTKESMSDNTSSDTANSLTQASFFQGVKEIDISDENSIKNATDLLLDNAKYLTFSIICAEEWVRDGVEKVDPESGYKYLPMDTDKYISVKDMAADFHNTFTNEVVEENIYFSKTLDTMYKDFDNRIYCITSIGGVTLCRFWDTSKMKIIEKSEEKIIMKMPVKFYDDNFVDNLEIVYRDGKWLLNESYLAYMSR